MIEQWRNQSEKGFLRLDSFLKKIRTKKGTQLDQMADKVHVKVFKKIDCLQCANCCSTIPPIVNITDQKRIAQHLRISISEFNASYLTQDEDGDVVMNQSPCPFLEADNKCNIYDVRPKACRAYPHTDHGEFSKNLNLHKHNIRYCPAAFHIVERLSHIVK